MQRPVFKPIQVNSDMNTDISRPIEYISTVKHSFSLEDIIIMQEDEKKQKQCIYKLQKENEVAEVEEKNRFKQVRVKSIEFEEEFAIAVYFYDFSHHMESMKLQGEIIEQKARN